MNEENGKPVVGAGNNCLGVRVPPSEPHDVEPDGNGHVHPGKGMSVFSHWSKLPPALIPARLSPRGRGGASLRCFRMGTGEFATGTIGSGLELLVGKKGRRGEIGPTNSMHIDAFQLKLAATRNEWVIDES